MSVENLEKFENKPEKEQEVGSFESLDLEFLSDIILHLKVEVGRAEKLFADVLKLKEGDVITLNKSTEDYLDIYLNNKIFAIGEMVVVNEKYSVRLVDIV